MKTKPKYYLREIRSSAGKVRVSSVMHIVKFNSMKELKEDKKIKNSYCDVNYFELKEVKLK